MLEKILFMIVDRLLALLINRIGKGIKSAKKKSAKSGDRKENLTQMAAAESKMERIDAAKNILSRF